MSATTEKKRKNDTYMLNRRQPVISFASTKGHKSGSTNHNVSVETHWIHPLLSHAVIHYAIHFSTPASNFVLLPGIDRCPLSWIAIKELDVYRVILTTGTEAIILFRVKLAKL